MLLERLFSEFDRHCLLGIPIWHFGYRSFFRRYGQVFLWRIAFPSPAKFAIALRRARTLWKRGPTDWVWETGERLDPPDLAAVGFCMKPECPSGRFSHRCVMAEVPGQNRLAGNCAACAIPPLLAVAHRTGAAFYIMTSGYDIARHVFIPNLRRRRWRRGLFFLCPYSAKPFLLAALTSGLEARLVTFCEGACSNYAEFLKADRGDKPQITRVDPSIWRTLSATDPRPCGWTFTYRDGVYWPVRDEGMMSGTHVSGGNRSDHR